MKRTLVSIVFLAGFLLSLNVQAEMDPEVHQRRMREELKLNDQQAEEVRKIFEEARPQLEALRQQRKEIHDKMREKLKAVLTPEQQQKFEKMHEERRAARRQGRPQRQP